MLQKKRLQHNKGENLDLPNPDAKESFLQTPLQYFKQDCAAEMDGFILG